MSGVWVFKNGVMRLKSMDGVDSDSRQHRRRKVLVYLPTNEVITSYRVLEEKLREQGWVRYIDSPYLLQFHKSATTHLISLPTEFAEFRSMHMYDIVVKNRHVFLVRDDIDSCG